MSGQRKALIIASDEYEHEGLHRLQSPTADADALAAVLGDAQIGDFDVQVVHNEPAHVIQAQIEELFAGSRPDDLLLLHFSCHGLKSESGELFFAARNTRPHRLGSTAVPAEFVQRCMRTSRSRSIVVLLDCCYGGAFGEGVAVRAAGAVNVLDSFPGEQLRGGRGRAVITASSSMEYAFEGDRLADGGSRVPSVFTAALVEGLATGDADRDEDGWVALNELYEYVFDRVRERNPNQTPSRDIEMQGELYLARSRRRRIRPLPIPADLQAAATDPNMFTRLGALSELRSRLASENLPVAAGAYQAVTVMADSDIRHVADAATAVLREAAIQVTEPVLHFGQVVRDSSPAPRTIHFLGPPLARACTLKPSHKWIQVHETSDGFQVTVDTSATGTRSGTITATGPTGEAVILVDVEVPLEGQRSESATDSATAAAVSPVATTAPTPMIQPAAKEADLATPAPGPGRGVPRQSTLLRVAGELAILGAVLLFAGLFPEYQGSESFLDKQSYYTGAEWYVWYAVAMAVLALAVSVCTVIPRIRRLIGPGLLLGAAASSTMGLAFLISNATHQSDSLRSGFWLELAAHGVLILAAGLTGLALVWDPEVRLSRLPRGILAWWVVVLGGAGAGALSLHTQLLYSDASGSDPQSLWVASLAAAVIALIVPACAALAAPRKFGVFLLAGWIASGANFFLYNAALVESKAMSSTPIIVFGLTLLGQLIISGYLFRASEPTQDESGGVSVRER